MRLRLNILPAFLLGPLGLAVPFMREVKEMRFTFDRPYRVDSSKFAKAFWSDPTPFDDGVRRTALAFLSAPGGLEESITRRSIPIRPASTEP